ncbi:MAG: hypothetical protein ACE5FJ_07170, partial [Gemmatimonadales bacterium]
MSRAIPYDFLFGTEGDDLFDPISRELNESGLDATELAQFARLGATQRALDRLAPTSSDQLAPDAVEEYLTLLMVCFCFWMERKPVLPVDREPLIEALSAGQTYDQSPPRAAYLQLPENLFWCRVAEDAPYEPIDGIFIAT